MKHGHFEQFGNPAFVRQARFDCELFEPGLVLDGSVCLQIVSAPMVQTWERQACTDILELPESRMRLNRRMDGYAVECMRAWFEEAVNSIAHTVYGLEWRCVRLAQRDLETAERLMRVAARRHA